MGDISQYAVPLDWQDGEPCVGPLMTLLGDVEVVGLGEPTHGDSQSLRIKRAIVRELSGRPGRMLLAWERGVGHLGLVSGLLRDYGGLPREQIGLMYPWVYQEMLDMFDWLGEVGPDRDVLLRGVDMDGPPPEDVIYGLVRAVGQPLSAALMAVQELATETKDHAVSAGRWNSMTQAVSSTAEGCVAMGSADHLLLRSIEQWGEYERLKATNEANSTPWEYRDRCLAENLLTQRAITESDRVAFWAHNGHVSKLSARAGWHLADRENIYYQAIGVAFGAGSFIAWEPKGGTFSRRLRAVMAQPPPAGSLEAVLQGAGVGDCIIDLRAMRSGDNPLAQPLVMREVGLGASGPQFVAPRPITKMFDLLVWIEEVSPATVIRSHGSQW